MKHNTLLLLIFVPILVYQLYHTFRYWKEGLEADDMPDFCKGKDGKLNAELFNKKTEQSKCKWKGVPEDDKMHCIYKQREWCEKDCKGKFDHKGGGDWCKDVGKGGKDVSGFPEKEGPQCAPDFIEQLNKNCPVEDGIDCKCWEENKINKSICKFTPGFVDILGGSTPASAFKMNCSKGYNKSDFFKKAMSEGTSAVDAEMSWKTLSKDGYMSSETVKKYILKTIDEGSRKEKDDAERKKAGIAPKLPPNTPKPYSFLFDGCPRGSAASKWKMVQGTTDFEKCKKLCSDDPNCNAIEINGCGKDMGDSPSKCNKNCYHFYGDGTDFRNGGCVKDGSQKAYKKNPKTIEPGTSSSEAPTGWYLGKPRESCTDVCKKTNKPCNVNRMNAVSTSDEIKKVAKMLGLECDGKKGDGTAEYPASDRATSAPMKNTEDKGPWRNTCRYNAPDAKSSCDTSYHLFSRFCPCGEEPPLSGKSAAVAIKTRKLALASGKTLSEADKDAKAASAKISDGGTSKDRVQDIIKNIAGGGGSIAAQAIGSQLAKLESDKKAAEAAMAKIPKSEDPTVKGNVPSGSLDATHTVPGVSQTTNKPQPSQPQPSQPQPSQPSGSNETYSRADKPDDRISWPTTHKPNIKENSNCMAFCGYKTPYCQDIVKGSTQCQSAIRVDTKEGCEKFNQNSGGNKCKWQTKEYRPCTNQCKGWGCANCKNTPSPPPSGTSGGNSPACSMCRARGSKSKYCPMCIEICKKNGKIWNGKDCVSTIGGCGSTQYGCCPDGKTAKKDFTGYNCYKPPSDKPIEGRFKAWIDRGGKTSFEAKTTIPPTKSGVQQTSHVSDRVSAHEKQFHPQNNNSSKQTDLKGTSLEKVSSEVNKNGWCIPQKNKQGQILSWIAKSTNTPGWSKTDKCLTIDGKEIIFGTGSCLQGQSKDECNLGLVKLQKDKYWHTHPVLLRKVKETGPAPTQLGSKYV